MKLEISGAFLSSIHVKSPRGYIWGLISQPARMSPRATPAVSRLVPASSAALAACRKLKAMAGFANIPAD
jgi:hypothetical protein